MTKWYKIKIVVIIIRLKSDITDVIVLNKLIYFINFEFSLLPIQIYVIHVIRRIQQMKFTFVFWNGAYRLASTLEPVACQRL